MTARDCAWLLHLAGLLAVIAALLALGLVTGAIR